MRDLANDADLFRAEISLSLFHVATGIKLDLWRGDIVNWSLDAGPEFKVTAADGLYELFFPNEKPFAYRLRLTWFDGTVADLELWSAAGKLLHTESLSWAGAIQLNDVFVDERQIVYTQDRFSGGLGATVSRRLSFDLAFDLGRSSRVLSGSLFYRF